MSLERITLSVERDVARFCITKHSVSVLYVLYYITYTSNYSTAMSLESPIFYLAISPLRHNIPPHDEYV